jgi:hypothetical protein
MSWPSRRLGDALPTRDGACRHGLPECMVGSGGLRGPAVWFDPVPAKQLPQPLDLAVQVLVLLDNRPKVHPGCPGLLLLGHPRKQLAFLVAQACRPLELLGVDRSLLLPAHLGELLLRLAELLGHRHADQPRPRNCLLTADGVAGQQLDDLLADPRQVAAQPDQHLGGHPLTLADQPEQDVLGPDVVVAQLLSLTKRQLQDLLGSGSERDVPGGGALALAE